MAHKRNSVEVPELEKLLAGKKKKYVRYEEGAVLYSMGSFAHGHALTVENSRLHQMTLDYFYGQSGELFAYGHSKGTTPKRGKSPEL